MDLYSGHINKLIDELAALPGIGNKSAQRLAFHMMLYPYRPGNLPCLQQHQKGSRNNHGSGKHQGFSSL